MISINVLEYYDSLNQLASKIDQDCFDAIICLKRSGFIVGVFLSNKFDLPLFTQSEISSIPEKFKKILIVDDKIQTGKSINKIINRIKKYIKDCELKTASLFIEGNIFTDYYVYHTKCRVSCWYE